MKTYSIILLCLALASVAEAQHIVPLSYPHYMEKVATGNLNYAAERMNVPIYDAQLTASKVFNDPNLAVSYFNNENNSLQMGEGVSVELSKTFTFGKRSAGIALARSEKDLAESQLADYFRNLRADATISYMEAMKQHELYKVKQDAYQTICELAVSDSIRFVKGTIKEIDATQSRLEAGILRNDLIQAEADLHNSFATLNLLTGNASHDTLWQPTTELRNKLQSFVLADLLNASLQRADLISAMKNKDVASKALTVAKRERYTDVDLSIAVNRNTRVHNEEAPAPAFTGVTAGIAIPIRFSNINKGKLGVARFQEQQAKTQLDAVRMQVQNEVLQAWRNYESLTEQVKHYEQGMLSQAGDVIKGKIYSYNRGEVSLLEVLDAQRTYDDVRAQYIETLFNYNSALVELERAAGIWDFDGQKN